MDLSVFFQPISDPIWPNHLGLTASQWGKSLPAYTEQFPDWRNAEVVLVGLGSDQEGEDAPFAAASSIRKELYHLSPLLAKGKVVDVGDLQLKESPEAYQEALTYVVQELLREGKMVLCLGGGQKLTYGMYVGFEGLESALEYVQIDAAFDVEDSEWELNDRSYNHRIFLHEPHYLFSYTNLGYQRYLVTESQKEGLNELNYAAIRYGELLGQIEEVEPWLRTAHLVSFDLSSVRRSEAPGSLGSTPGGFSAAEACQIARYTGLGQQCRLFHISGLVPEQDLREATAQLSAMLLWYVVDGYNNRQQDELLPDRSNLRQYTVRLHATVEAIDFYLHSASGRWWMAVPYPDSLKHPHKRSILVPCSPKEYEFAKQDDIPARWWQVFHLLGG